MKLKVYLPLLLVIAALALALRAEAGPGSILSTIHRFGGTWAVPPDGAAPFGDLLVDATGSLYGTTAGGGAPTSNCPYGCGTVFKLSRDGAGGWIETVLHSFGEGTDGMFPFSDLMMDASGALYGTTTGGGANRFGNYECREGCGTVYMIAPDGAGGWTETVIYNFAGGADGAVPYGGLIADAAGALYGTTHYGGNFEACPGYGCGTVFKLTPGAGGWTKSILHTFSGGADGADPRSGLIFDETGALYGTTIVGGSSATCSGCGTVFKLAPDGLGGWTKTTLHHFGGADGTYPNAGLIADAAGALYGTTEHTDVYGAGAIYRLSPGGGGGWTFSVLHTFSGGADGAFPLSRLAIDAAGVLYGTTYGGGTFEVCGTPGYDDYGCGTVFKLTPDGSGGWTHSIVHAFTGEADGNNPRAGLIADASGMLYGTTARGGTSPNAGTVFRFPMATAFSGSIGQGSCRGQSVSPLVQQYGSLAAAAASLGYPSTKALQDAIAAYCGG